MEEMGGGSRHRNLYAKVTILSNFILFFSLSLSCSWKYAHNAEGEKKKLLFSEEAKPSDVESSISDSITYIFYVNNREVE